MMDSSSGYQQDEERRYKKTKLPVRRALSKWILFSMERRPLIVKDNPHFSFKEIANLLADQYRNIDEETSKRLDLLVMEDKNRYNLEKEQFDAMDKSEEERPTEENQPGELIFYLVCHNIELFVCNCLSSVKNETSGKIGSRR